MCGGEHLALLLGHVPGPGTPETLWPLAPYSKVPEPWQRRRLEIRSPVTPNQVPVQDAESFRARLRVLRPGRDGDGRLWLNTWIETGCICGISPLCFKFSSPS